MSTIIKICGLSREEDIETINDLSINYVGFVFANSKRQITFKKCEKLINRLNSSIIPVGVFVNPNHEEVYNAIESGIKVVQFHGVENPDEICNFPRVIKAIKIDDSLDINYIEPFFKLKNVEAILLDGINPGSGNTFNWNQVGIIKDIQRKYYKPILLAGGLNPNNIIIAINSVNPDGVDVSSGVETQGIKDSNKIRDFVKKVKEYDSKH